MWEVKDKQMTVGIFPKKRGRSRLSRPEDQNSAHFNGNIDSAEPAAKKKRGRPKKNVIQVVAVTVEKKKISSKGRLRKKSVHLGENINLHKKPSVESKLKPKNKKETTNSRMMSTISTTTNQSWKKKATKLSYDIGQPGSHGVTDQMKSHKRMQTIPFKDQGLVISDNSSSRYKSAGKVTRSSAQVSGPVSDLVGRETYQDAIEDSGNASADVATEQRRDKGFDVDDLRRCFGRSKNSVCGDLQRDETITEHIVYRHPPM